VSAWNFWTGLLFAAGLSWVLSYVGASTFRLHDPTGKAARVLVIMHRRLWWFGGPAYALMAVDGFLHHHPIMAALNSATVWCWWTTRKWPDDDEWQRRKKKVKEVVKVLGARLVTQVAPG